MEKVAIPFGNDIHHIKISEQQFSQIYNPVSITNTIPENELIDAALEKPVGSPAIEDLVTKTSKIVIISEDNSRYARTDILINALLERLYLKGIQNSNISIILALGSHRKMTTEEIHKKIGKKICDKIAVYNSEFYDKKQQIRIGYTAEGTEIRIDKRVMKADVKIGIGSIVPHPALGYSGGAKIIFPGVAGEEVVSYMHLNAAKIPHNIMGLVDNAARTEMEQWVEQVGLNFIINSVITPQNQTYKIVAGHYREAHRIGVTYAKEMYSVKVQERVDMLVVSSHTADMDLWQATKGIIAGERIVKDGGLLVLYTPCYEGIGPHSDFPTFCAIQDIDNFLAMSKKRNLSPETILALSVGILVARAAQRIRIGIISPGITKKTAQAAGFIFFGQTAEDLQKLLDNVPLHDKIGVLPRGGEIYAYL